MSVKIDPEQIKSEIDNIKDDDIDLVFTEFNGDNSATPCSKINTIFSELLKSNQVRKSTVKRWKALVIKYVDNIKNNDDALSKSIKK